jgi:hypothetical protein
MSRYGILEASFHEIPLLHQIQISPFPDASSPKLKNLSKRLVSTGEHHTVVVRLIAGELYPIASRKSPESLGIAEERGQVDLFLVEKLEFVSMIGQNID